MDYLDLAIGGQAGLFPTPINGCLAAIVNSYRDVKRIRRFGPKFSND